MKEPSMMHAGTERLQMQKWTGQARTLFSNIRDQDRRKYVYVVSDAGKFFVKTGQAKFWDERFGMIWRNVI
jgi:hypothetical protein